MVVEGLAAALEALAGLYGMVLAVSPNAEVKGAIVTCSVIAVVLPLLKSGSEARRRLHLTDASPQTFRTPQKRPKYYQILPNTTTSSSDGPMYDETQVWVDMGKG
eukprot:9471860-Pyramimonas_sp.AAC.2